MEDGLPSTSQSILNPFTHVGSPAFLTSTLSTALPSLVLSKLDALVADCQAELRVKFVLIILHLRRVIVEVEFGRWIWLKIVE